MMRYPLPLAVYLCLASVATALGPRNVVVLARTDSPDSLRIANAYIAARGIPNENLILLPYAGSPHHSTWEVFERDILKPTKKALEQRKLERTVHVWATTLGIPWRIDGNGLSGVVHFGRVIQPTKSPNLGPAGFEEVSKYAGVWLSIDAFNSLALSGQRPLHMHLAAGSVESTLAMIERSAKADGTFPAGTFYLCDGGGPRSSRKHTIPRAMQLLQVQGARVEHLAGATFTGKRDILGLSTGDISFPIAENAFLPGALADHLTSTGGVLDGTGGQMMCTAFLDAGCSASYGTVVEPYNYPTKFPAALVHAAYRAGFTAVESYWMSVAWPQQGVFVGDPLARPFGKPPESSIKAPAAGEVVGNEMPLHIECPPNAAGRGVGGIEIRIDGEPLVGVGQQRLPADAVVTVKIGDKEYSAASPDQPVLSSLLGALEKKLEADGWTASTTPATMMLQRTSKGPSPPISVSCTSNVLHGEVVGGKFLAASSPGEKELAWLRFSTGPRAVSLRLKADVSKIPDGFHRMSVGVVAGDETTASSGRTIEFVKRTRPSRLRLKPLAARTGLSSGRREIAEASFEGGDVASPVEFRVDERVVEARLKPPFKLSVDPKSLGVGRHVIRARTTTPILEADEEVVFHVDP